MTYAWIAILGGALSFVHCLGMCGGFALHLSGTAGKPALGRQLCWHAGRISMYAFLGALAGFAGARLHSSLGGLPRIQNLAAGAAGILMILMGLRLLGYGPTRRRAAADSFLAAFFRPLFTQPTGRGALALGLATGLLPCPIVVGYLALAAHSRSVTTGMLTMAALGLGTVWALLLLGLTGHLLRWRLQRWSAAVAAALLILLGGTTLLRGTRIFHRLLGCPAPPPAVTTPGSPGAPSCCE